MLTDDMLWDYADGFLGADEKLQVDAYLRQYPEQQERLNAILREKRSFSGLPLEKPKADFAQNVMAAWAASQAPVKSPASAKGRDWILWCIAAGFGLIMILPFWLSPAAAPSEFSVQIPDEYLPQLQAPNFDWAALFNSALLRNAMLLTLAFMSLKLLDKYLQVRNHRLAGH